MNRSYFIVLIAALVILTSCGSNIPSGHYDQFAKCLTEKGATFYGAFWCPHCEKVKKSFGDSVQYLHYVECDPRGENSQSDLCIEKKIERYATFEFADGTRIEGEPTHQQLSEKTGCPLPPTP